MEIKEITVHVNMENGKNGKPYNPKKDIKKLCKMCVPNFPTIKKVKYISTNLSLPPGKKYYNITLINDSKKTKKVHFVIDKAHQSLTISTQINYDFGTSYYTITESGKLLESASYS